jgi:ATF/CREB family transcription factor
VDELAEDRETDAVLLPAGSRHVRASSDPVSRGGAFSAGDLTHLLDQEPNLFEQSFSGPRHSSFPPEQTYDPSRPRAANANAVAGPSSSSSLPGVAAVRRARSISPSSNVPRATPSSGLGPIGKFASLMGTPGGVNELVGSFRWDVDSLRSGPLSPALLTGPTSSSTSGAHSLFDPTTLRTGLTPLAPSGNISFPPPSPATAALFAMMTNNTPGTSDAAIVAGMSGGGSRPHEGVNEGNYFEASFARATDGGKGGMLAHAVRRASRDEALSNARGQPAMGHQLDFAGQHLQGPPTPLNALQRAALTSQRASIEGGRTIAPAQVMHPSTSLNASELGPPGVPGTTAYPVHRGGFPGLPGLPGHFSQQQHQQNHHYLAQQQQQHLQQQQGHHLHGQPGVSYLPNPAAGGNSNNPLYLLSQAQDMSSSHHDDAVGAAAALSNLSGPGHTEPGHVLKTEDVDMDSADSSSFGFNGIGTAKGKRGGPPPAPPASTNKRKKAEEEPVKKAPAKKGKRGKAVERDEDMDDFDDGKEDSMSPVASNPNETEEEKRKNFLERNRQGEFPISTDVVVECP